MVSPTKQVVMRVVTMTEIGDNPMYKNIYIYKCMMAEILHQLIGSLSHY